ncbi:MAG: hypothetical protein H0U73_09950 [Tatlockia sp.]|nr:hypothetical protein [Tatlockia sp.]
MPDIPETENSLLAFDSAHKAAWYHLVKNGVNFKNGSLTCTSSFDDYNSNRIKDISGFNSIKAPDNTSITEILKVDTADSTKVKTVIADAFKSDSLDTALEQFNKELKALNTLISGPKPEFGPTAVASYLLSLKGDVKKAIDAQHKLAKDKLNEAFNDDEFKVSMKNSLNCSDAQLNAIQGEMMATLDKSQTDELQKVENAIGDNAKGLFQAATNEFHRLVFLADRYFRGGMMRDVIQGEIDKHQLGEEPSEIELGVDIGARFKNVKVENLTHIDTIQHSYFSILDRPIQKNADGSYSMKLNRIYQSDASIRQDIASLVQALVASDVKVISITINNKDPKRAEKDARLAYEAAIVAGADPKKLVMIVNGEEKLKYDDQGKLTGELFKGRENRLKYAQDKAAIMSGKIDSIIKGTEASQKLATLSVKKRLAEVIQQQPLQEANVQDENQQHPGIGVF